LELPLQKVQKDGFLARLIEPAGHDEPGLLAFNGGRFGDLGKNRRAMSRAQGGGAVGESGVFAHRCRL